MTAHGTTHAKWFCDTCSPIREPDQSAACPECCGFRGLRDWLTNTANDHALGIWRRHVLDSANRSQA